MKKTLHFLRSMRFGMVLLVMIVLCSLAGSFVTQGEKAPFYRMQYGAMGDVILALHLDNVFFSWYFILLGALLCLNLLFCSVLRLGNTRKIFRSMPEKAAEAELEPVALSRGELAAFLRKNHFKPLTSQNGRVFARGRLGHYGTFLVHLAMLLLLFAAAGAIYFSKTEDVSLRAGEQLTLHDGTRVTLDAFRTANEGGEVVYESDLSIRRPDGSAEQALLTVNHPLSIAGQKLFQMGYGIEGRLTITHEGVADTLPLANQDIGSFLTLDGKTGVIFQGLYPDYKEDESGISLVKSSKLGYPNPVYAITRLEDGQSKSGVAQPGITLRVGGVDYAFEKPVSISTFRIKTSPPGLFALLYFSFVLLIAGIWLAFFQIPAYVRAEEGGYALRSAKPVPELAQALAKLSAPQGDAPLP